MNFIAGAGFFESIGNFFGNLTGDGSGSSVEQSVNALKEFSNYLHPVDMFQHLVNQAIWGLIKLFYGLAKWASTITDKAFGAEGLIGQNAEIFGVQAKYIQYVVWSLMVITLMVLAYKMVVSKEPPQIKNIFVQLIISVFLITNLGPITREISNLGKLGYDATVGTTDNGSSGASSIPFELIRSNTNDTMYLLKKDFSGIKAGSAEKFGTNQLTMEDFEDGRVDMTMDLTPSLLDSLKDAPGYNNNKRITPDDMKMKLTSVVDDNGKNSLTVEKMGGVSIPFHKIYEGGYQRFPVAALPTIIGLIALTVAFLFASFVIIKAFLDLAIMQVIGVLVAATDLNSGQKTKKVIESLFQAALTITFTGIEIAFYKMAIIFFSDLKTDPWVFVIMILAATVMLITGSEKTAMFFGVDTGAQKGWRAVAQTAYLGAQIGRGAKSIAKGVVSAPKKVANGTKNGIKKMAGAPASLASLPAKAMQNAQDIKNDVKEKYDNMQDDYNRASSGAGTVAAQAAREERQELRNKLNPNTPDPSEVSVGTSPGSAFPPQGDGNGPLPDNPPTGPTNPHNDTVKKEPVVNKGKIKDVGTQGTGEATGSGTTVVTGKGATETVSEVQAKQNGHSDTKKPKNIATKTTGSEKKKNNQNPVSQVQTTTTTVGEEEKSTANQLVNKPSTSNGTGTPLPSVSEERQTSSTGMVRPGTTSAGGTNHRGNKPAIKHAKSNYTGRKNSGGSPKGHRQKINNISKKDIGRGSNQLPNADNGTLNNNNNLEGRGD